LVYWKEKGNEITPSHKNARFTVNLKNLRNVDKNYNNHDGVEVAGIIYGGRDPDTMVPVLEAYDWDHGIISMGAALESETTAATLGKTGVRKFNPMSNMDFLSIPVGKYVDINLKFGESLEDPPKIFGVNYFLKNKKGGFLNEKTDKRIWLKWMELRTHKEVGAVDIGIGFIPNYKDLEMLFKNILKKEYSMEDYIEQFKLRIPENISKIDRIIKIYREVGPGVPEILFKILGDQKSRLEKIKKDKGLYISPLEF
jgi:phosphoenolpyruvate carboxykinase (GTP)